MVECGPGRRPAGKTGMDSLRPIPTRSPPAGRQPASSWGASRARAESWSPRRRPGGKGVNPFPCPGILDGRPPCASGPSGGRRGRGVAPPATFRGSPGPPGRAVHPPSLKFPQERPFLGSSGRWRPGLPTAPMGHVHPVNGAKVRSDEAELAVVHSFHKVQWPYEELRKRLRCLMGSPDACRRHSRSWRGDSKGE